MANPSHATRRFKAPIILKDFLISMIPLIQVVADNARIPRINIDPLTMIIGARYRSRWDDESNGESQDAWLSFTTIPVQMSRSNPVENITSPVSGSNEIPSFSQNRIDAYATEKARLAIMMS